MGVKLPERGKKRTRSTLSEEFAPAVYAQSVEELSTLVRRLSEKVAELVASMEKIDLAEYIQLYRQPGRLLYFNFMAGVARGLGMAVGFTLLGAIGLYFLKKLVVLNLPLIGNFIATLVEIVQLRMQTPGP